MISFFTNKKKLIISVISIVLWLLIWGLVSVRVNSFFLPSPLETIKTIIKLLMEKATYLIIGTSLIRVMLAVVFGFILSIVLGIISTVNEAFFRFMQPFMVTVKSTPVASFIIIAMVYMDIAYVPIFCGFLLCLPVIYYNVIEGMKVVDMELVNMAKLYKVPLYRLIQKIYIPSVMPYIGAGLITAIGISWKGTIAAEVIGVINNSIGYKIYNAKVYLETPELFAWTVIIISCSMAIESLTKGIIRKGKYYKGMKSV